MSKNTHPAAKALRELKAFQERRAEPFRQLAGRRWPDRAISAGVSARIRRCWWSVISGLLESGTVAW